MKMNDINISESRKLFFEANRYCKFLNDMYREEHKRQGVEWMVLSHSHLMRNLYAEGELTMTEITERIGCKAPTTTVLVKKLKKEGYVDSRNSSEDNRISLIYLTAKGKEHCEKMEDFLRTMIFTGKDAVSDEDVEKAVQVLRKQRFRIKEALEERKLAK